MLQRLPVGIETLPEIINGNYLYVDKTQAIHRLITSGKYFFLARPRRFGKSLTLSTIKEIYQGNRALFQGLWVEQNWDWDKTNPVIHISFSSIGYKHIGLKDAIQRELLRVAQAWAITLTNPDSIALMFAELMKKLTQQHAKVVVLIDEYDKPLIDYLDDVPQAKENQQTLKAFYSVIKGCDPYIELFLLTGISKLPLTATRVTYWVIPKQSLSIISHRICQRQKPISSSIGWRCWRNYVSITMAIRGMVSRGFITLSRS